MVSKVVMMRSDNWGCGWYRVGQHANYIKRNGVLHVDTFNHNEVPVEKLVTMSCFHDCDVVVAQRVYEEKKLEFLTEARKKYGFKLVYEIDDDLEAIPVENPAHYTFKHQKHLLKNFRAALRISDAVTVSSKTIYHKLKQYNKNTHIIDNAIDFFLLNRANKPRSDNKIRLFWYGSNSHLGDILDIMGVIDQMLNRYEDLKILFWGFKPEQHDIERTRAYGVDISRRFNLDQFYSKHAEKIEFFKFVPFEEFHFYLSGFGVDISLAPLVDTQFNRARTNLKWLESSAIGLPTICQNTMTYKYSVEHGETGFLCKDDKDWMKCIAKLVENKELRDRVAGNAHDEVRENWCEEKLVDRMMNLWDDLCQKVSTNEKRKSMPSNA